MNTMLQTLNKTKLSIKAQALAALIATAAAVALPQLCHLIGWATGTGNTLGIVLSPMHLPVLLVGLLAGPLAVAATGFLSPLVSFALTGMPFIANLPLMMAELLVYGLATGWLRNIKMPTVGKVFAAQVAGRLCYAAALALAIYAFGNESLQMTSAISGITAGIWGILLQLISLPLIVKAIKR